MPWDWRGLPRSSCELPRPVEARRGSQGPRPAQENTIFMNNWASPDAFGDGGAGGAVWIQKVDGGPTVPNSPMVRIDRCTFRNNYAVEGVVVITTPWLAATESKPTQVYTRFSLPAVTQEANWHGNPDSVVADELALPRPDCTKKGLP